MKKLVMTLANQLRKAGLSLSEAVKRAWATIRLKAKLATTDERGEMIRFKKEDGTERWALATRNLSHVPADKQPKGNKPESATALAITFFDIIENGWRSFRADRLILQPVTAA